MIGSTPFSRVSTADTNAAVISAAPTQLTTIIVSNINAAIAYLKIYDKATTPSEADTPKLIVPIPGGTAGTGGAIDFGPEGIQLASGLAIRIVTGAANSNTTAVAASEVTVSGAYYSSTSDVTRK